MARASSMTLQRAFLTLWIGGLVALGITILLSMPLVLTDVPQGIIDHQKAATAIRASKIQRAWEAAGLFETARLAMISDLLFIGIYGIGSLLGGLWLRRAGQGVIGSLVVIAAIVFLFTDYAETLAQFSQLLAHEGDEELARLAATVQPVKMAAWCVTIFGVLVGLYLRRKSRLDA